MGNDTVYVSKSGFAAEAFRLNPGLKLEDMNRRWQEAGHEDLISKSTYEKVRRELKVAENGHAESEPEDGTDSPAALERDLDELIYRAMHLDDMDEVAGALRSARRVLILAQAD